MITAVTQTFRLPVQQSGTNYSINLPVELRGLFGIEKSDVLVLVANPNSETPLVVAEVQKAANKGLNQTTKGGSKNRA